MPGSPHSSSSPSSAAAAAGGAFTEWMAAAQARTEAALASLLPPATAIPARLHQAMRYSALGGGKRVRPLLVFAAGEITGAAPATADCVACAVECIHVYSLVHDDLPAMDDDALRRGRPTCHVAFDEATALLVGDSLQALAFELLARAPHDAARQLAMVRCLAAAAGSCGMAGGQAIDLEAVGKELNEPELELMHTMKTGALIRAAVLLGALAGQTTLAADEENALDRFAKRIGLLFQVVDDILDCTASTATLGKTAGKDAAADKPTYVSLLGLDRARRLAADLEEDARQSLRPFGNRAERLLALAAFVAQRQF